MLLLVKAVEPQVLAKTHLRDELSILWKMVVKLLRIQVFARAFEVTDVESHVKADLT